MMKADVHTVLAVLVMVLVTGCGGGGDRVETSSAVAPASAGGQASDGASVVSPVSASQPAIQSVSSLSRMSGAIVKGPVDGAVVCAYAMVSTGKGALLGCTVSQVDGSYALDVDYIGPVLLEASGGTYTEEATGASGTVLQTILVSAGTVAPGDNVVVATPLTTLAVNRAAVAGELTMATVSASMGEVRSAFGLGPDVDLARSMPNVARGQSNAYGTVLAGISTMVSKGAALSKVVTSSDLSTVAGVYGACIPPADRVPTGSIALNVNVGGDTPGAQDATVIRVVDPVSWWRTRVPVSGEFMATGCNVAENTASLVVLSCAVPVGGVDIYAGSTAGQSRSLPASDVLMVAGRDIQLDGGTLKLKPGADVSLHFGEGEAVLDHDITTDGRVTVDAMGTIALSLWRCSFFSDGSWRDPRSTKVYDSTTTGGNTDGAILIPGDTLSPGGGTWGSGTLVLGGGSSGGTRPVSITGVGLSGADASNLTVLLQGGAYTVAPAAITPLQGSITLANPGTISLVPSGTPSTTSGVVVTGTGGLTIAPSSGLNVTSLPSP